MASTRTRGVDAHKVTVPEGELDGVKVERFTITEKDRVLSFMTYAGRAPHPGTYTRLIIDGVLMMSDTPHEWYDHLEAVWKIEEPLTDRVLINGLGIGMVLKAAIEQPHIKHIDVVELDERVVKLVGPHYDDPRVTIHTADAYTIKWPPNTRWDVVWHDIWPELNEDNLEGMGTLHRRYGRRTEWQGSWGRELLLAERRRTRDAWWR